MPVIGNYKAVMNKIEKSNLNTPSLFFSFPLSSSLRYNFLRATNFPDCFDLALNTCLEEKDKQQKYKVTHKFLHPLDFPTRTLRYQCKQETSE